VVNEQGRERKRSAITHRSLSQRDKIDPSVFEEVEGLDKIFERAPW